MMKPRSQEPGARADYANLRQKRPLLQESPLSLRVAREGAIPLCWAAATQSQDYLNFGDALSCVMVAAVSGMPVDHAHLSSPAVRMSAVGTIGHGLRHGAVTVWGTGSSSFANPGVPRDERLPYAIPPETSLRVHATRGPISWSLLTGAPPTSEAVYGDPVWLLPAFYDPPVEKRWELGVILHLSELTDRATVAHYQPGHTRYGIPPALADQVTLINTITPIGAKGLQNRIDDILACKRIVSTSLHGLVIAETYGIPCLYFPPLNVPRPGPRRVTLGPDDRLNLRMSDLYQGLGLTQLPVYLQPRDKETDWLALCRVIDRFWKFKRFDAERLLAAFPLPVSPLDTGPDGLFDHPLIKALPFQHVPAAHKKTA